MGRLHKATLERANEAGGMLVANCGGDLLDSHVGARQELSSSIKPLLNDSMTKTKASLLLEQMLKMRLA